MKGFKSFVRETEIPFTEKINVVMGPNGSGKSNVSDALCFVLGRLSIKSMRAAKAKNLIFMGSKSIKPSKEASVKIIFDNSNNVFLGENKDEVSIQRIVRKNGQSIYKINGQTRTRQDVLNFLSQANIDPNGFNIILQGEIQNFVKMHPEERRKIIEEVSGISVYESRKQKSLKELDKTEQKLKEVNAILRERTNHLNNLEKERQQALKYKKLQADEKKLKKSIIHVDLEKRKKEREYNLKEMDKTNRKIEKINNEIKKNNSQIQEINEEISKINSQIKESTGLQQEKLSQDIATLRADIAGLEVKLENNKNKLNEFQRKEKELNESLEENKKIISQLQKESPSIKKKQEELEIKKKEFEKIEQERKKHYMLKSEIKSLQERIEDKKILLNSSQNESEVLLNQINLISKEIFDIKTTREKVERLQNEKKEKQNHLDKIRNRKYEIEKNISTWNHEINKNNELITKISKMDICPLCKHKITEKHIQEIKQETLPRTKQLKENVRKGEQEIEHIKTESEKINQKITEINKEISKRESDLIKLSNIEDKKNQIKTLNEKIETNKNQIQELTKKEQNIKKNFDENSNIEERYENVKAEMQDIEIRNKKNLDSEISFKQREYDRLSASLKQIRGELPDLKEELIQNQKKLDEKHKSLSEKKKQEEELNKKYQKLFNKKEQLQKEIRNKEINSSEKQNEIRNLENILNNYKIEISRINAKIESLETEILEYPNSEIIKINKEKLEKRLIKTQEILSKIGSVNMRSLEVYEDIKKEYESVKEKCEIIGKEKNDILGIISEIDIKKKRTFLKTLKELNEIFSRNFSKLSSKGDVYLDLENKKEPFNGGVNIIVKTGHGKYFDVTSLSGGEQTLVALSLIFAIQELNPYNFYILDEIDAALDKRNSERLANLLKKYMQKGQYIIITHNDEIISNATAIYGISMHDGVSKITSMKI